MKLYKVFALIIVIAITSGSYLVYTRYVNVTTPNNTELSAPPSTTAQQEQGVVSFSTTNKLGFESLLNENIIESLPLQGILPSWIQGSFFINGPAQFELEKKPFQYWFDGFAMIHRFSCNNGSISYANKFLKSSYYTQALKNGTLPTLLSDDEKPSFFSRMKAKVSAFVAKRPIYDNANVHITTIDGTMVALTETPCHIVFDPTSLKTCGSFTYNDSLDGHICTAHPIIDHATEELFNVLTTFGTTSTYHIYSIPKNSKTRKEICSITSSEPSYIHSFSITQQYIILTLVPLILNPLDLLFSTKAFLSHYKWTPERKTEFIIIDRKHGTIVTKLKTDPFFVFHHVNAYEQNNTLVVDLISYPDHQIIYSAALKQLCSGNGGKKEGTLQRFTLNLKKNTVTSKVLCSTTLESPRINERYLGKHYSYAYAVDASNKSLLKINVQTGKIIHWQASDCYTGEPVFVAKPGTKQEDDGCILSCVLDAKNKNSFLLILDAKTFKELARAPVPHHIPFSFHGIFISGT